MPDCVVHASSSSLSPLVVAFFNETSWSCLIVSLFDLLLSGPSLSFLPDEFSVCVLVFYTTRLIRDAHLASLTPSD